MVNVKLSGLPGLSTVPNDALIYVVSGGVSYKTTKAELLAGISSAVPTQDEVTVAGNTIDDKEIIIVDAGNGALVVNNAGGDEVRVTGSSINVLHNATNSNVGMYEGVIYFLDATSGKMVKQVFTAPTGDREITWRDRDITPVSLDEIANFVSASELAVLLIEVQDEAHTYTDNALDDKQDVLTELNFAAFVLALTNKNTPVDADGFTFTDSTTPFKQKKTSFVNIWTNYFKVKADAIYTTTSAVETQISSAISTALSSYSTTSQMNTALDLKSDKASTKHILLNDNSLGSAIVGTTTPYQSLFSVLIPANTLSDLDTLRAKMIAYKTTGTAGTTALRLYTNTTNNFSTATQLAITDSFTAGSTLLSIDREIILRSGSLDIMSTSLGVKSDISIGNGGTYGSPSFNPAVDNYLFFAFSNNGDTVQKRSVVIERTRNKTTIS